MSVVDLEYEREKAQDDNTSVRPLSVLRMAQEYVAETEKVTKILVIVESENDDETYTMEKFRGGMTRYEELAILHLAARFHVEKWASGE